MSMIYKIPIFLIALILVIAGIVLMGFPREQQAKAALQQEEEVEIEEGEGKAEEVTLISVYDNYQVNTGLKTAWGFGTIVKTPKEILLFDTGGNSEILLFNMEKMDIDPQSIDKVIISHIHGDHIGGLKGFLERNNNVTVFIPNSFPNSVNDMITEQNFQFYFLYWRTLWTSHRTILGYKFKKRFNCYDWLQPPRNHKCC
jgi:7,8-dihydropterin-6-yl-methyl-4-(beta-D-ribofuranosyl)aminobenzene 5'-phosphate synthase